MTGAFTAYQYLATAGFIHSRGRMVAHNARIRCLDGYPLASALPQLLYLAIADFIRSETVSIPRDHGTRDANTPSGRYSLAGAFTA